jgi:hypothetical protein
MRAFVVLISGLLVAAPAFAQSSAGSVSGSAAELSTQNDTPESSGAADSRDADGERRICRRIESDSSSRMATRRVCRTAAEWRESQRAR